MSDRTTRSQLDWPLAQTAPDRRTGRSRPGRWLRALTGYLFIAPAVIYLLVVSIYPLVNTLQMSLLDVEQGQWLFVGLQNYVDLFQDPWFWNSIRAIAIFTTASVILHVGIGLALALLLNETWFSLLFRDFMRGLLILPWIFSTAASALMWTLLFHPFGILNYVWVGVLGASAPIEFLAKPGNAMASIIAVNTWKFYPFYMIIILGGLQAIPVEIHEAARVDGANAWQRFRYVTLPQLKPVLIAISTIDIITTFGHVDLIKMMTKGGPFRATETVAYYVYKTALLDGNLGYGAAVSSIMLVMLTILTFFYLRVTIQGDESEGTNI